MSGEVRLPRWAVWSLVVFSVIYGAVLVHDLLFDQVRFAILLAADVVLTLVGVLAFAVWSSGRTRGARRPA